jgi:hypothetical protein
MKNGCERCEKLPDDKLCDWCQLDMLKATVEAAMHDYKNKLNEIKEKSNDNHRNDNTGRPGK